MPRRALPISRVSQTWKYALLGGLVSMPLVLGDYWLSGWGNTFPNSMVIFGGLLAGYLAEMNAADVKGAAIGAGVVGGLPGYVWILPAMVRTGTDFATAWSSPVAATVVMGAAGVFIIGACALIGLVGGIVGAWLAKKTGGRRSATAST